MSSKDVGFSCLKEREKERTQREESAAARRSINPFVVIATRSRYTREIKFRISLARVSLLPEH